MPRDEAAEARPGATVDQLRTAIDRGETGEKTPFPDPAAAPLGTDDEAGGIRHDPHAVQQMLEHEKDKAPPPQRPRIDSALVTIGLIVVAVCIAFVWFALTAGAPR